MRILVDTNILFSALLFPNSKPSQTLLHIANNHTIILCDKNISEIREIVERKKPDLSQAIEIFLAELSYELIPAVSNITTKIRDTKDQPILNAAILADVDLIITGDKDFLSLDLEHPKCITAAQFLTDEGVGQ